MLKNLLNQTATIWNLQVNSQDDYGNDVQTYVWAGNHPCRVQPFRGTEFEFDRDTRHNLYRIMLDERAATVLKGTSHITLDTHSQRGDIIDSVLTGVDNPATVYELYGDPQVFHKRSAVSHVEAELRTIEG